MIDGVPWAGPADAPGLKRWGTLPLVFAVAGACGGAADALASELVIGAYRDAAGICAWIGGGIGLGIGAALAISSRWWIAVPLAPVLGAAGHTMMVIVANAVEGSFETPRFGELLKGDEFLTLLAAVASPVLVAAHCLWLRWPWVSTSLPRSVAFYSLLGAVSGSVFWYDKANGFRDEEWWMGLGNGAIYGLFQLAAMRAARAMACGLGLAGKGRTPS